MVTSVDSASTRSRRFRHIVFADAIRRRERILSPAYDLSADCSAERRQEAKDGGGAEHGAIDGDLSGSERALVQFLFEQGGLDVRSYRTETLRRRLSACLRALRVSSVDEARNLLRCQPSFFRDAIETLIIGVTSFFRDPSVFDSLYDLIRGAHGSNEAAVRAREGCFMQKILQKSSMRRGEGRGRLCVWSAGCSQGAELFSVAMMLEEMGLLESSCLLGTDCRPAAIVKSREGLYEEGIFRGTGPERVPDYRRRFFSREDGPGEGQWRVHHKLRGAVHWRNGNVLTIAEPGMWDIILCRNLAIYLEPSASASLWQRLEQCLKPGGFLVTGSAERPLSARRLVPVAPCIYMRATN